MDRSTHRRVARVHAGAAWLAILLAGAWLVPSAAIAVPLLIVDPDTGLAGSETTVIGRGFVDLGRYRIMWDGVTVKLADVHADTNGFFQVEVTIPTGAAPGNHIIRACPFIGCPLDKQVDAVFTVLAPPTPKPTPKPTPRPTPRPTTPPGTTPTPGTTPGTTPPPTAKPTSPSASPSLPPPATGQPGPTFPEAIPTPVPTPLPVVVVTPAPTPPSGVAAPSSPFPDLDVIAIEVTQGVQNLANSMPLVAGRRTFARVHIDVEGALELAYTHGILEARRDGDLIGSIWPENGPITARANGGDRVALDDSLYFRLPASWLDGEVQLRAFVYSHDPAYVWSKEPVWQNNFETVDVRFYDAQPIELHLATLHLHRSFHPTDVVREYVPFPDGGVFATEGAHGTGAILAGMWRFHPISAMSYDVVPLHVMPLDHGTGDEWDLGDCHADVIESFNPLKISDWRVLMKDPEADLPENVFLEPDRTTIWVLDSTFKVDGFWIRDGGVAELSGTWTGPRVNLNGAPAFVDTCPNPGDESGSPNSTLGLYRALYDWSDTREFFVGLVDGSLPTRWGGLASGDNETAWVNMNPDTYANSEWYLVGATTFAHEVGHLTGLKHVACKDDDGDGVPDELVGGAVDPTHPQQARFPSCSLAEVIEHGYYGFDVYHDLFGLTTPIVISNDPGAGDPNRGYPLLGYKTPRWIDPFHYCRLLVYYGVPCDVATIDEPFDPPGGDMPGGFDEPPAPIDAPPSDPGVPLLMVGGMYDPGPGVGTVDPGTAIDDPTDELLERYGRQGEVPSNEIKAVLVALDATGAELARAPIVDRSSVEERGGPFRWDVLLPLHPATDRLGLVGSDGRSLATADVSRTAPTGRWTSLQPDPAGAIPEVDDQVLVVFEAGDADGDNVTATLLYSADDEHWQVVAAGLAPGSHTFGEEIERLPGAERGRFRLLVSDGVRTSVAAAEPVVAMPNRAPAVRIEEPARPLTLPLGGSVRFGGDAFDPEDRALADVALTWTSSIDGPLGHGRELEVDDLSAGRHQIQLIATDSGGATAGASVELVVDPAMVEADPPPALAAELQQILDRFEAGENPGERGVVAQPPAVDSGPSWPLIVLAVALVVLAVGGASVWIRVSQPHAGTGQAARADKDITMKGSSIGENGPPPPPGEDPPEGGIT